MSGLRWWEIKTKRQHIGKRCWWYVDIIINEKQCFCLSFHRTANAKDWVVSTRNIFTFFQPQPELILKLFSIFRQSEPHFSCKVTLVKKRVFNFTTHKRFNHALTGKHYNVHRAKTHLYVTLHMISGTKVMACSQHANTARLVCPKTRFMNYVTFKQRRTHYALSWCS